MRISGFTIVRNAVKFNYPAVESIKSILPICDEFIVNVGDCEDETLELIKSIKLPLLRKNPNYCGLSLFLGHLLILSALGFHLHSRRH